MWLFRDYSVQLHGWFGKDVPTMQSFLLTKKYCFLVLLLTRTKLTFNLFCIHMLTIFANRVGPLLPFYRIVRLKENLPQCLKWFLRNFNVADPLSSLAKTANMYIQNKSNVLSMAWRSSLLRSRLLDVTQRSDRCVTSKRRLRRRLMEIMLARKRREIDEPN